MDIITLAHGSGGELSQNLIKELFFSAFNNDILGQMNDSAVVEICGVKIAFTTDSYVINPIIFPGADIGRLAVCGTVNDLSMVGAKPIGISCGFIIEEGLEVEILRRIVQSMKDACEEAGVLLITGDTKVVNKGAADKIFINTSGIGIVDTKVNLSGANAQVGDKVIVSGNVGDHGAAVLIARNEFEIECDIKSDAAPLNNLVQSILVAGELHVLRDPTRGGVATTLNEIAEQSKVEIELEEDLIPIDEKVNGICSLLGMDPLYLANEGKLLAFVPERDCERIINTMKQNCFGENAKIIGTVKKKSTFGKVYMNTINGGTRVVNKLVGDFLPRIC